MSRRPIAYDPARMQFSLASKTGRMEAKDHFRAVQLLVAANHAVHGYQRKTLFRAF